MVAAEAGLSDRAQNDTGGRQRSKSRAKREFAPQDAFGKAFVAIRGLAGAVPHTRQIWPERHE
jgi:hypothetical protein